MAETYYRPLAQTGPLRPEGAKVLAGGLCWFTHVDVITRAGRAAVVPAARLPQDVLDRLTRPRADFAGLSLDRPKLMGILNVTPDSFSDGGRFVGAAPALAHAQSMAADGADIIDIGGESTRPGAHEVPHEAEIARTAPVIGALAQNVAVPISIDTRKAAVAEAALEAGAQIVNDVSGLTFDAGLAPLCAKAGAPVVVMHSQGLPETMQDNPAYDDVVLDVYDYLETRVEALVAQGIARERIVVDPGIGFGKTMAHNLALIAHLSLFHGLGCGVMLAVSRKGFIRKLGRAEAPDDTAAGSIAVGLAGLAQGVQLLRVHDVRETKQALRLWQVSVMGDLSYA